jgi:ERO1-like protein alpha
MKCQEGKPEATVDRTLDTKVFKGWVETDNPWTADDETDNGNIILASFLYIMLHLILLSYHP